MATQCQLKDLLLSIIRDYGGEIRSDDLVALVCEVLPGLSTLAKPSRRILRTMAAFPEVFALEKIVWRDGDRTNTYTIARET